MKVIQNAALTQCLSKAGLTAGTTTTYTTANATNYSILGKMYTVAAQTNTATPTTDAVTGAAFTAQAINTGCVYVFGFNAAGSLVVAQGATETIDSGLLFERPPAMPSIPADFCPFAYAVIKVASTGAAWTFGSSNWTATGVTDVYQDVNTLPDRPQIA